MSDGTDEPIKLIVDPPPPPRAMRMLSFAFGIGAGVAGFAGFCELAAILALVSVAFNLADYFMNRRVVEIPRSAFDTEGRLKSWKRPEQNPPPRPRT